jgi:hypothetical protein
VSVCCSSWLQSRPHSFSYFFVIFFFGFFSALTALPGGGPPSFSFKVSGVFWRWPTEFRCAFPCRVTGCSGLACFSVCQTGPASSPGSSEKRVRQQAHGRGLIPSQHSQSSPIAARRRTIHLDWQSLSNGRCCACLARSPGRTPPTRPCPSATPHTEPDPSNRPQRVDFPLRWKTADGAGGSSGRIIFELGIRGLQLQGTRLQLPHSTSLPTAHPFDPDKSLLVMP